MRRRSVGLAFLGGLAIIWSGCSLSRATIPSAFIDQIQADPATFLGRPLLLEGTVQAVNQGKDGPRSYTLSDSSGRSIEVRTDRLPTVGARVRLYAQVAQNEANVLVPYLIETKHTDPDRPSILATAVLGLLGVFFLFVLTIDVLAQVHLARARKTEYLPALGTDGKEIKQKSREGPKKPAPPPVPPRPFDERDRFRFSVVDGPDKGREIVVEKKRVYVGRGDTRKNDVELLDATVSRRQAVVVWSRKRRIVMLINQAHTNPTSVNGNPVRKGPLHHGDVVKMGKTRVQVFFEAPASPLSPDVTPMDPRTVESTGEPRRDATPDPSPKVPHA